MVVRYTYKFVAGDHTAGCFHDGEKAVAICTDRMTGEEYWVCEKHTHNKGKCQRRQLHPDFIRDLHTKNQENGIVNDGVKDASH